MRPNDNLARGRAEMRYVVGALVTLAVVMSCNASRTSSQAAGDVSPEASLDVMADGVAATDALADAEPPPAADIAGPDDGASDVEPSDSSDEPLEPDLPPEAADAPADMPDEAGPDTAASDIDEVVDAESAGLCPDDSPDDLEVVLECEATGGRWVCEGSECFLDWECGQPFCGRIADCDCDGGGSCDCGPTQTYLRGEGCVEDPDCPVTICERTSGEWGEWSCVYDCGASYGMCNGHAIPGCFCGMERFYDPAAGCVPVAECTIRFCELTGGEWDERACSSYVCGELAEDGICGLPAPGGCDCGPGMVFDEAGGRGCVVPDETTVPSSCWAWSLAEVCRVTGGELVVDPCCEIDRCGGVECVDSDDCAVECDVDPDLCPPIGCTYHYGSGFDPRLGCVDPPSDCGVTPACPHARDPRVHYVFLHPGGRPGDPDEICAEPYLHCPADMTRFFSVCGCGCLET